MVVVQELVVKSQLVHSPQGLTLKSIPLAVDEAISSNCKTKFVPSYINSAVPFALITQVCGSFPSSVLMFFAHKLFILILQAQVLVVVNLQGNSIPVV